MIRYHHHHHLFKSAFSLNKGRLTFLSLFDASSPLSLVLCILKSQANFKTLLLYHTFQTHLWPSSPPTASYLEIPCPGSHTCHRPFSIYDPTTMKSPAQLFQRWIFYSKSFHQFCVFLSASGNMHNKFLSSCLVNRQLSSQVAYLG